MTSWKQTELMSLPLHEFKLRPKNDYRFKKEKKKIT